MLFVFKVPSTEFRGSRGFAEGFLGGSLQMLILIANDYRGGVPVRRLRSNAQKGRHEKVLLVLHQELPKWKRISSEGVRKLSNHLLPLRMWGQGVLGL
jgi:hypothetical protein